MLAVLRENPHICSFPDKGRYHGSWTLAQASKCILREGQRVFNLDHKLYAQLSGLGPKREPCSMFHLACGPKHVMVAHFLLLCGSAPFTLLHARRDCPASPCSLSSRRTRTAARSRTRAAITPSSFSMLINFVGV